MTDGDPGQLPRDRGSLPNGGFSGRLLWLYDQLLNLTTVLAGVLLVFLMFSVCLEVVMRYFFSRPTSWVVEISGYILLYIPFMVAAWVLKEDGHVRVDIVYSKLSARAQALTDAITSSLAVVVSLILVVIGLKVSLYYQGLGYKTPTVLMLPKSAIIFIIPFGFFLLSIQFIRRAGRNYSTWMELRKSPGPQAS